MKLYLQHIPQPTNCFSFLYTGVVYRCDIRYQIQEVHHKNMS